MTDEVSYITGAIIGMEKKGKVFEVNIYDHPGRSYFCKEEMGIKVGSGYKLGIVEREKKRYEIVSVEQQIMKDPAFTIKGPQTPMVQMKQEDYKELVMAKNIRIRNFALDAAIKICKETIVADSPQKYASEVKKLAKDLEMYFE